jgi:replicative DNA helicase
MGTEAEGAQAHRLHSRPVSFDWDELRAEALSPSVALDSLPVWDGCEDGMGEDGMGEALTEQLAGGLRLGQSVVIGAPKAGGGKTAFVQQLVDGLALRNAARESGEALTPVFVFSEMRAAHWQYRSIARWAGLSYGAVLNLRDDMVDAEARRAAKALSYAAPYLRVVSTTARELRAYPDGFAAFVSRAVASWRRELEASEGGPVWPVVVVDPIQRLQNHEHQETEALNELAEELTEAARSEAAPENAFILIMTSDTTKGAKSENGGASVIRGSYKLFHSVDIAIALFERERENAKQLEKAGDKRRLVELDIAKNRWGRDGLGPRYLWSKHCGRFEETKEEPAKPKGKGRADSDKSAGPETNGKPQKSGFDL